MVSDVLLLGIHGFFVLIFSCMKDLSSQTRDGTHILLQWKHGVLNTGPPGKSQDFCLFGHCCTPLVGFPHSSLGKESACNAGDPSSMPGSGRSAGEGIGYPLQCSWASFVAQLVKESACNAEDLGLIPGLGRSPGEGKGYPLQYSGLENAMDL